MKFCRSICTLLLVPAGLAACGTAPARTGAAAARAVDQELALLTFDSAWSRIANSHYDTAYGGVDWPAVRAELRPRAAEAGSMDELRAVIGAMLERLGESHFVLIPAEAADALGSPADVNRHVAGDAGVAVRLVDGQLLVWRMDPAGPAARAGIRTGWAVEAVAGRDLRPLVQRVLELPEPERRAASMRMLYSVNAMFDGQPGDDLLVTVRADAGASRQVALTLRASPGEMVRFGNLPPMRAALQQERLSSGTGIGGGDYGCVGVIRMNVWMVPVMPEFDRALDALRDCRGIVLDLRGNPGGVAGMVMGTSGHFLQDTVALGVMRTRTSELRFRANPRRVAVDGRPVQPFGGLLAIVVDELSASTTEIFAAGMQGIGRARVFGARTAGQALPALMVRLPTNDVLMHAIADFTGPGGIRIEGDGVVPDVGVQPTRAGLLAGRDAALDAAIDWINDTNRPDNGGN
jgi:carboxyl-terminal processing protease